MFQDYLFSCQSCVPSTSESKLSHSAGLIYLVHTHLHSCFRNRPIPCGNHCCVFVILPIVPAPWECSYEILDYFLKNLLL